MDGRRIGRGTTYLADNLQLAAAALQGGEEDVHALGVAVEERQRILVEQGDQHGQRPGLQVRHRLLLCSRVEDKNWVEGENAKSSGGFCLPCAADVLRGKKIAQKNRPA